MMERPAPGSEASNAGPQPVGMQLLPGLVTHRRLGLFDKLRGLLLAMLRQGESIRLAQTAAGLTFLSLLAIVPMFSIALTVLAALPMFEPLRDALQRFIETNLFLPSFADTLTRYMGQFASQARQLSLFGAIVFFATAFSALLTIDRTLNQIWVTERPRSIGRRITLYWTLLTMGPLLIGLSIAVNGVIVTDWLAGLPILEIQRWWYFALSWSIGLIGLTLMYYLLPNVQVRWRDALLGALLAAIVLECLRRGLTLYVANLPTYTVIYGAFSALPLFLIWLYLLWMTILLGALLAANLRHWGSGSMVHAVWTPAQRFDAGARILMALTVAWRDTGSGLLSADALRPIVGTDPIRADELGRLLGRHGYIHRHWRLPSVNRRTEPERAVWDELWGLARSPDLLTLRGLFEAVWQADEHGTLRERVADRGEGHVPLADAPLLNCSLDTLVAGGAPLRAGAQTSKTVSVPGVADATGAAGLAC